MGPRRRVRAAKCQMLVTSFFVLLLGLSVAAMAALTYFGAHFAAFGRVAWEKAPHKAVHRWAVCSGAALAGLLTLGALLCAAASVREAGGLMAGGFLCFALVFCGLVQVAFWRHGAPTQLEDAALDAFDLLYELAVSRSPAAPSRELLAIQDAFQCCGKSSPLGRLGGAETHLCPGPDAARQGIRGVLGTHASIASALTGVGLAVTAYAMLLSSFLWFAIRAGHGLDRKGKYTPKSRARGCRPAPSFYRCTGGPCYPADTDLLRGCRVPVRTPRPCSPETTAALGPPAPRPAPPTAILTGGLGRTPAGRLRDGGPDGGP